MWKKSFEILDLPGDVGLKIYGGSLSELFENSALGFYSLVTDIAKVSPRDSIKVVIIEDSVEKLLIKWLNELIFQFDAYGFIGKKIDVKNISSGQVGAVVTGESFDENKHDKGLLVKAATYHNLSVAQKDDGWQAEVVFDI